MNDKELAELRGRYKPRTMTDEQLAEIRARCEAATPGPWEYWEHPAAKLWQHGVALPPNRLNTTHFANEADSRFVAAARTDVPALLDEVERLRARYITLLDVAIARGVELQYEDADYLAEYKKLTGRDWEDAEVVDEVVDELEYEEKEATP